MPVEFRLLLTGHDVFTVTYMKWTGIQNGTLMALAARNGFEVMVTTDAGIAHQHNPATLPLAVVIIHSPTNGLTDLRPLAPAVVAALGTLGPQQVTHVG